MDNKLAYGSCQRRTFNAQPCTERHTECAGKKHITAFKNVKIFRKNAEGDEKAYGDRADYFIKNRKITLTGTAEKPPVLYKGENTLATRPGSKVIVDLAEQIASTVGGAEDNM